MAAILLFENASVPLNLIFLRGAGFPDATQWRLESGLNRRYSYGGLAAVPQVVASRRSEDLCVIGFLSGPTPLEATAEQVRKAMLDAAIVRRAFECEEGRVFARVQAWLLFEDGGRIELFAPQEFQETLLAQAQATLRCSPSAISTPTRPSMRSPSYLPTHGGLR